MRCFRKHDDNRGICDVRSAIYKENIFNLTMFSSVVDITDNFFTFQNIIGYLEQEFLQVLFDNAEENDKVIKATYLWVLNIS